MNKVLPSFFSPQSPRFPEFMAFVAWLILCIVAITANGTADEGDSVNHYLYSRYAFAHPENFFNHWAKPIFVMITAPVAYFGFTAMKLFNATMLGLQMFFNIKIARRLNMSLLWMIPWITLSAPHNFTHTLSGLTEPMFATVLTIAIWLMLSGRIAWSYVVFSFLPLVRSEGLIILCPLLVYALWRGHFRYLPLFAVGHLAIGLLGYKHFGNIWWTITNNPYKNGNLGYGHGTWYHYVENMPVIIGGILCFLGVLGLLSGFYRLILRGGIIRTPEGRDEAWLVYGMFLAYLIAHSIFWWKGLFASYGLLRVFLCIMPSIALICLRGIETLDFSLSRYLPKSRQWAALAFIPILWFLNFNPRVSWRKDLQLNWKQGAMRRAVNGVVAREPNPASINWYTDAPDAALATNGDYFDRSKYREGHRLFTHEPIPPNSFIIWDDHFMDIDGQVKLKTLQEDPRFEPYSVPADKELLWSGKPIVHIFKVKPEFTSEVVPGWSYEWRFDTMTSSKAFTNFAGRNCWKIDTKNEYSEGFQSSFGSFPPECTIAISFDLACEEDGSNIPGKMGFSCSTVHDDYLWKGFDLKDPEHQAGKWKTRRFTQQIPKYQGDFDHFKTYVWNNDAKPIYLANFKVELVK